MLMVKIKIVIQQIDIDISQPSRTEINMKVKQQSEPNGISHQKVPTSLNGPEAMVSFPDTKPGRSGLMHSLFFGAILTIFYLCYDKKWEDKEQKLEAADYVW